MRKYAFARISSDYRPSYTTIGCLCYGYLDISHLGEKIKKIADVKITGVKAVHPNQWSIECETSVNPKGIIASQEVEALIWNYFLFSGWEPYAVTQREGFTCHFFRFAYEG